MVAMGATVSVDEADVDFVIEGVASLVRVMSCDRPLGEPARISLEGVTTATFGRGDAHAVTLDGGRLAIAIPDDRMSGTHARLTRNDRRFVLEDCESKNGTAVNGKRVEEAIELADGDVIETGHTFFVYRARVPRGLASEPS